MNFLEKVLCHKHLEIRDSKTIRPERELRAMLRTVPAPLSLREAIRRKKKMAIIAEMKKASPSAGVLRTNFDPAQLAVEYQLGGAAALSVLTDKKYFGGSLSYIRQIRPLVQIPVLRKDFIVDSYQVLEARAFGADAVLLIAAALSIRSLHELLSTAHSLQMDALVEVHNPQELESALAAGANLIGINNRNLETFSVDLAVTERLASRVSPDITLVAESGVHSPADARRMYQAGAHALLIGTYFMQQSSPGKALETFKEALLTCCV